MEKLPNISTVSFVEEIPTDGHSPMHFLCEDGANYYCKHRTKTKREEIQCLLYEVLCSTILKELQIPTPEIALINITEGSFEKSQIKANKYVKANTVCFGSKELSNTNLLSNLNSVKSKSDFNQFSNPEDLIRIAIFDFWTTNSDRGRVNEQSDVRSNNYNILLKAKDKKTEIIAFDHAFTFGAPTFFHLFKPEGSLIFEKGLLNTSFSKQLIKYIPENKRFEIVDDFISLIEELPLDAIIDSIVEDIPEEWIYHKKIIADIKNFLKYEIRINTISEHTKAILLS